MKKWDQVFKNGPSEVCEISLVNTLLQVRDEAEIKVSEFCERWCKPYN